MWLVGDQGKIYSYDCNSWFSFTSNTTEQLNDICQAKVSGIDRLYTVGSNGKIMYFDAQWKDSTSPTTTTLRSVYAVDYYNIYAVGDLDEANNTIVKYISSTQTWETMSSVGATGEIYGVWGINPDNLIAVGKGVLGSCTDRTNWVFLSLPLQEFHGIWGNSTGNFIVAVGKESKLSTKNLIVKCENNIWEPMTVPDSSNMLYSVWGTSKDNIFAVGENGTILYYGP